MDVGVDVYVDVVDVVVAVCEVVVVVAMFLLL